MLKPSKIDRIKGKTERVKELFSLRNKVEDAPVSLSAAWQTQESGTSPHVGSSAPLHLSNTSNTATLSDDNDYEKTPIGELWDLAYKKIQQEDSALIEEYETRLRGSVTAALGSTLGSEENRGKWMNIMLRCKMDEVQKNIWKFSFRGSEVQPAEVVQPILGVVKMANDFIATALASNPYASLAWTGVSALLSLFLNPMDQAASLAQGLEYISSLIVQGRMREELYHRCYEIRHGDRQSSSVSHVLYKSTLEKLYRQILKFQATCYCYYAHDGAARLGHDIVGLYDWAGLIEKIQQQENQMAAINQAWSDKQYDEECAAADERHKETIHSLMTVGADISGLRKAVEEANAERGNQEFYRWLCDIDPSEMYNAARKSHEVGTSEWFIGNEQFESWMNHPRSLLWLHGKAGSGKSVLSSSIIRFLQNKHKDDASIATAYYYFSFSDTRKQERDVMLASLIKQICCCRPSMPKSVERLGEYKNKGMRPPTEDLEKEFIETVRGFSTVHIIIDALDECPELGGRREDLMKTLRYILNAAPDNLHVLCTSRKEQDIDAELRGHLSEATRIEFDLSIYQEAIKHDIGRYIDSTLADVYYRSWPDHIRKQVKETLIAKSDGMFQYVRCQFEVLRNLRSPSDVQQALGDLPKGLDQTYERMLHRIDHKYRKQVLSSLKWLAFSLEHLSVNQLAEIFVIQPEHDVVLGKDTEQLFDAEDVLQYFSGLIIVQYRKVRLAHFSVKEYLTSSRIRQNDALVLGFGETDAHLWIAYSCLAYHIYLSTLDSPIDQTQYLLKTYAACNWLMHLEMVPYELWTAEVVEKMTLCLTMRSQSLLDMLIESKHIKRWDEMFHEMLYKTAGEIWQERIMSSPNVAEISGTKKYLVQEDLDMALYSAVRGGSPGVAQLLLDEGANANASIMVEGELAKVYDSGDVLQEAAYQGSIEIVTLLLDEGADVNAERGGWGSALQAAAKGKHSLAILKLLVERGANVNGPSNEAGCVLSSSVKDNCCLRFLLERGADVNMRGTGQGEHTALYEAAKLGRWDEFDLLLEQGADANLGGKGGYPLHGLASNDWDDYKMMFPRMKRLLDLGADANAQNAKLETALYQACEHHMATSPSACAQVVQLLIHYGADVNIVGGEYGTVLQACAYEANIHFAELFLRNGADGELIQILLDQGADINARGGLYETALQAVCCSGTGTREVRMLLQLGVDVNVEGGKYGNALQAACCINNHNVVVALLDHGANINAVTNGKHGTALQACASNPDESKLLVRLLLERGAEVNVEGGKFGNALQAACARVVYWGRSNQVEIIRTLLEHGAHMTSTQSGEYGGAFQAASISAVRAGNGNRLLQLLLDHGANVNECVLGELGSALHCTLSREGFIHNMMTFRCSLTSQEFMILLKERIRFLLDHGADVNLKAGRYGFPLQAACSGEFDICRPIKRRKSRSLRNRVVIHEQRVRFINIITDVVKMLLDECPQIDVNARGGIFGTALQAAAYSGQTKSVRLLLDHGADVVSSVFCGRYRTALNAAVIRGHWDIVDILLQAGAEPDCHSLLKPDEEWLMQVQKEHGQVAVERYRKFWEVEKSLHEQALLRRGRHVAYYHFIAVWLLAQFQLFTGWIAAVSNLLIRKHI
ncbi:ankyrin repeat-containing domain protein [Trichoderma barbatum]